MTFEVSHVTEPLVTRDTFVGSFPGVGPDVGLQMVRFAECFLTSTVLAPSVEEYKIKKIYARNVP